MSLLVFAILSTTAMGQWTNATETNHDGDAELNDATPFLNLDITGTIGAGSEAGIRFEENGSNAGSASSWLFRNAQDDRLYYGGSADQNASNFSISDANIDLSPTQNGSLIIGDPNGSRVTIDNNELAAKTGTGFANTTFHLNFDGGNVEVNGGNTVGDFTVGSLNAFYVDNSAAEVGIGTNAPAAELHIEKIGQIDVRLESDGTDNKLIRWYNNTTQQGYVGNVGNDMWVRSFQGSGQTKIDGETGVDFLINGSTKGSFDAAGNFGLGTLTPLDLLHIEDGDIRLEAAGVKTIDFFEGNSLKGLLRHNGTDFIMQNDETGGIVELDGQTGIDLRVNNSNALVITNDRDVGIGDAAPQEKLEVAGNIALSSPETGGSTAENRNHLVYGVGGKKRLQFSSNSTSTNSWAWINMFGDETCTDCEGAAKRGNLSMAGKQIFLRTDNDDSGFGTVAVELQPDQDMLVTGDIYSGGILVSSDRRLKRDVKDFSLGLDAVKKIEPKQYFYNGQGGIGTTERPHVGVIAQEFKKIAPDHVVDYTFQDPEYDMKEDYLAVDEGMIKFMLINSVKELAEQNDTKDARIEALEAELNTMKTILAEIQAQLAGQPTNDGAQAKLAQQNATLDGADVATLAQNQPNPFNENTVIKYTIPEGSTGAHMNIFTAEGKLLKAIQIDETGAGQINLTANSLPAGNYMYQLVTDKGVVGSKTMILAK